MPKRTHPHNAEFQRLLHDRGMTLIKLAKELRLGKTHVHLCQVVNGRRVGHRTMLRLRDALPENEWTALLKFRGGVLGEDIDKCLDNS